MKCPVCGERIKNREFYDHMCEIHGWALAEAEKFADDWYTNIYDADWGVIRFPQSSKESASNE